MSTAVRLWREPVVIPTYELSAPEKNPMFLERRVYQGSSGKVYPLPVTDRIAERPTPRSWDAVYLENEYLRVMILPEIGGRIHAIVDKTNGYDLIYRQDVIKPALVGLAGPWISGGIEFNWPQHHRPSTFMACDVEVEEAADGSKIVWLSEHDPISRMKGMHGVCLHPGRAVVELKVRAYNRTAQVQTFLWWANVATRVHERYQSFFPPDVHYVADHAKRSMSAYPLCRGSYYGVDYSSRTRTGVAERESPKKYQPTARGAKDAYAENDLSWYANIPVPTSYMCMGSREDFFGGYDHRQRAGIVHVADRHIAPGKKQWTWGNHEFGYAWDRNLTVASATGEHAPYIELMAGVYTDNQPDFSFLQPGETKAWSQYWYPIREIGPAQQANVEAAVSIRVTGGVANVGIAVTRPRKGATLCVNSARRQLLKRTIDVAPEAPHIERVMLGKRANADDLLVTLHAADGTELLRYQPTKTQPTAVPPPASEPLAPEDVSSADELFLIGLHLEQYRHATRFPELYWREALRRDPGDARCNLALGKWHLRRGEFTAAEQHLRKAIERLTSRNPNPADGEAHYTLGLVLRFLGRDDEAYDAFYKATWNQAWLAAGHHALAEIDCSRGDWAKALDHLDRSQRWNTDNLRARNLKAMVLRRLNRVTEAATVVRETLALDSLDWWARLLNGDNLTCDVHTRLDLVHDHLRAGLLGEALRLLETSPVEPHSGTTPLVAYTAAWICHVRGDKRASRAWLAKAQTAAPDYCFPARLEELRILEWVVAEYPRDGRAAYYLGNLLYDRRRHREAIERWEHAVRNEPKNATAWRNLGLGYFNLRRDATKARRAYNRAFSADKRDARIAFERDQLWKRTGVPPELRLREVRKFPALVQRRDDLALEYATLLLQTERPEAALAQISGRRFQPWEGGEGKVRGLFVQTHLVLGRRALDSGVAVQARAHFEAALTSPENLGEARHLLANEADVYYWLGCARAAVGNNADARIAWRQAAQSIGDFRSMQVTAFSEKTYFAALALIRLGRKRAADSLLRRMLCYARELGRRKVVIDYFATSLPTMLLFDDDIQARQITEAKLLEGLAQLGLGQRATGRQLLRDVLTRDPNHAIAQQFI